MLYRRLSPLYRETVRRNFEFTSASRPLGCLEEESLGEAMSSEAVRFYKPTVVLVTVGVVCVAQYKMGSERGRGLSCSHGLKPDIAESDILYDGKGE